MPKKVVIKTSKDYKGSRNHEYNKSKFEVLVEKDKIIIMKIIDTIPMNIVEAIHHKYIDDPFDEYDEDWIDFDEDDNDQI